MLVEVMMSALLVALAATAVFKSIDGASATSAQSKSRAVAANLAHEDQERMRSMDPRKLASYSPSPQQTTVNRVAYTVASSAQFVSDRGELESCTKGDGRVIYVRISSTVTWPDMRGSKPVTASSIVAINNAYSKGSLAVKVVDRTGSTGVPAVPVSIDAPLGQSQSTNDTGCVVFDGLDTGAYYGEFSRSGYVDRGGNAVVRPVNGFNVTTGSTSVSTFQYDRSADASFVFRTKVGGTEYATTSPGLLLKNPQLPLSGERRDLFGSFQANRAYTNLFPFADGYTALPVACAADAPSGGGTPFTSPVDGQALTNKPGDPDHNTTPIKVYLPTINVRVTRNGSASTNMRVRVRPDTTTAPGACGQSRNWGPTSFNAGAIPLQADGWQPANANRGFTPGRYVVCVDDRPSVGSNSESRRIETLVDLTAGVSATLNPINIRTSSSPTTPIGVCP